MKINHPGIHFLCMYLLFSLSLLSLRCAEKTSASLENDARLQVLDFFDKQNKLFEGQKRYLFQNIVEVKRLDRKTAEVKVQYRFTDKYTTVDRTEEVRHSTFLLRWQDEGKLILPPDSEATRVHWVLTRTWDYDTEKRHP